MSFNLSRFHATFFKESLADLDVMESGLLCMQPAQLDTESVDSIFRAAHSIKGGSANFGFDKISAFTRTIELLLDKIRSGEIQPNQSIITTLRESVSCVREMLKAEMEHGDYDSKRIDTVQSRLGNILSLKHISRA